VNEMVEDDTTKMNARWKSSSQVKRAREVTSMRETDQGGNGWWKMWIDQKEEEYRAKLNSVRRMNGR